MNTRRHISREAISGSPDPILSWCFQSAFERYCEISDKSVINSTAMIENSHWRRQHCARNIAAHRVLYRFDLTWNNMKCHTMTSLWTIPTSSRIREEVSYSYSVGLRIRTLSDQISEGRAFPAITEEACDGVLDASIISGRDNATSRA